MDGNGAEEGSTCFVEPLDEWGEVVGISLVPTQFLHFDFASHTSSQETNKVPVVQGTQVEATAVSCQSVLALMPMAAN